jgi:sodium/bile acid cotransporter 7
MNRAAIARAFARVPIDPYLILILLMVALASVLPARGGFADVFGDVTDLAIALLFFLYGARLSRQAIVAGLSHWRLHLLIVATTFVLFPILGIGAQALVPAVLTPELYAGVLFLTLLPSTVQSSIAFTSIARGNVPAAVCAASASSLIGIFVTPVLTGALLATHGGVSLDRIGDIVLQLLVPFLVGQAVRRWVGDWLGRHKIVTRVVDRGSILLVVYGAFSAGVVQGIWQRISVADLVLLLVVCAVLLAIVLAATAFAARRLGFSRADEVVVVICGSTKSLAAGLPMANVLFAASTAGLLVLPVMLFHQIQLLVCATIARRYAARPEEPVQGLAAGL